MFLVMVSIMINIPYQSALCAIIDEPTLAYKIWLREVFSMMLVKIHNSTILPLWYLSY